MGRTMRLLFCGLAIFVCLPACAQQTDINRYTLFTGFDYLAGPALNLTERGLETDFGIIVKPWLGLGGDFVAAGSDVFSGSGTINGSQTIYAPLLNQALQGFGGASAVNVGFQSTTYVFAAGPQFYLRKWKKVTFLFRPGLGGIHDKVDVAFPASLGLLFGQLQVPPPSAHQTDTQVFFGLGGGFDLNVSRRVGIRFTADWVNTHLFSNLLTDRQNFVRVSFGPAFRFGHLK